MSKLSGMTTVTTVVNKHTGARCRVAPGFTLGGETAYLTTDGDLNRCELENYSIGRAKGYVEGLVCGLFLAGIVCLVAGKKSKKHHEEEK